MESAGLTALPVEVIHHISRYLSVPDVLSCSLTCHYLRTALNDDCVWRKYLPQDISGLETQEQQVSSRLEICESLTPLCEKRQQLAWKNHLMRNWRAGNYVQYCSSSEFGFEMREINNPECLGNAIYKDNYIFLSRYTESIDIKNNGIEIWDISKVPMFYTFFKIDTLEKYSFRIVESRLIINECFRMRVYNINLPDKEFPLLYSFLFTDNHVTFNEIVQHGPHTHDCVIWYHTFVRNYLISFKYGSNRLHIWDILSASKIGCFEPPVYAYYCELNSFIGNSCMFELMAEGQSGPNYLVTFDLHKKQFSSNRLRFSNEVQKILSYNSHVILMKTSIQPNNHVDLHDIICTLYDFNTSLELNEIILTNATQGFVCSSPYVVNGTFVITCHGSYHVISALTLDIVNTIIKHHSIYSTFHYINIYENVIAAAFSDDSTYDSTVIQLYDINRSDILLNSLTIGESSDLYLDSLCSKLLIVNGCNITVVHLW